MRHDDRHWCYFYFVLDEKVVTTSNQHDDVALASIQRGEMTKESEFKSMWEEPYYLDPHYLVSLLSHLQSRSETYVLLFR